MEVTAVLLDTGEGFVVSVDAEDTVHDLKEKVKDAIADHELFDVTELWVRGYSSCDDVLLQEDSTQMCAVDIIAGSEVEVCRGVSLVAQRKLIPYHIQQLSRGSEVEQLHSASVLHKVMSIANIAIPNEVLPALVALLEKDHNPELQGEAAGIAALVSAQMVGTMDLVKVHAVPKLARLLTSESWRVVKYAANALGNIAGDCGASHRVVVDARYRVIEGIQHALEGATGEVCDVRNSLAWLISSIVGQAPGANHHRVECLLPTVLKLMADDSDVVAAQTLSALTYFTRAKDRLQVILQDTLVVSRIHSILLTEDVSPEVLLSCLENLGNISNGSDVQAQQVIDTGLLPVFSQLLARHPNWRVREQTCWVLSNLTAGNADQVQSVIDSGLIPLLVKVMHEDVRAVKQEATWAVVHALDVGHLAQKEYILGQGCLPELVTLLETKGGLVPPLLAGLEHVFQYGSVKGTPCNEFVKEALDAGLTIGTLMTAENLDITSASVVRAHVQRHLEEQGCP